MLLNIIYCVGDMRILMGLCEINNRLIWRFLFASNANANH